MEYDIEGAFSRRHIGVSDAEQNQMLEALGVASLEEFIKQVIPNHLLTSYPFEKEMSPALTEREALDQLRRIVEKNKLMKNYIGMGFYDTWLPPVIQRNVLENPGWYTAYTPYQAEISQGRLESLLNYQTMVVDLTGLHIANASLLDEGTACAEAIHMALQWKNVSSKKDKKALVLLDKYLHPHVIAVAVTRLSALNINYHLVDPLQIDWASVSSPDVIVLAYPNTFGEIRDYRSLVTKAKEIQCVVIADTDLLALTLLTPPGEWGCDIAVGTTQRFGVPLFFGGPHAGFLAAKDSFKRLMPGRIVGVTRDKNNKIVYRLTLQTREQHILREKATSNICTAQALLANIAAMYAVYHGPQGLKKIAETIHHKTRWLAEQLEHLGFLPKYHRYFDTLYLPTDNAEQIIKQAHLKGINFRSLPNAIGISINETTSWEDLTDIVKVFRSYSKNPTLVVQFPEKPIELNRSGNWENFFIRTSPYLLHPTFNSYHSETKLLRYIKKLEQKDLSLTHSMIPLGSCTMKLNATSELLPLLWPEVSKLHPYAPLNQTEGYQILISDLEKKLCQITGYHKISFQPNSGAQGEYTGLLVIKKYLKSRGEDHRHICLVPSSAHGTNPASAAMAGFKVVVVSCDSKGNIDLSDLQSKVRNHSKELAALMVTYPSTHGVFEPHIKEICDLIHQNGGQVYLDGANLNALVGWVRPAELGADVSHMNLHKTFAIPHGGGGPGVGPIGVKEHLAPFLPSTTITLDEWVQNGANPNQDIWMVSSSPFGSAGILTISWMYISLMGAQGLKKATAQAILSANYIKKKLQDDYPVLFTGNNGFVAHECILDLRPFKAAGIDVTDVAKRLMDFGFHAPTVSWPVLGTLMIEPTESEGLDEINRFIDAMKQIRHEINLVTEGKWPSTDNPLKNAPHTLMDCISERWNHPYSRQVAMAPLPWVMDHKYWAPVNRADESFGDRNVFCTCPLPEEWENVANPAATSQN
ncbi:MAG: aminomethyl-transferring glycine dehydrogenase [Bdellovibrionaceae bacterium]|nr:aminomethyl-transferring glycine dehydrogenase [Pseudobdellovibrionaceae bacterium]